MANKARLREYVDFSMCFCRMVPRLKDKVKPNRRVRGSSDCGTPLITSILSVSCFIEPKKAWKHHVLLGHKIINCLKYWGLRGNIRPHIQSVWLSRAYFPFVRCINHQRHAHNCCLYWIILGYGIRWTYMNPQNVCCPCSDWLQKQT